MEHPEEVADAARPPTPQRMDEPSFETNTLPPPIDEIETERPPLADDNVSLASAETERPETKQGWYEICIEEEEEERQQLDREERERQEQREREAKEMRDRAAAAAARRMERRALASSDLKESEGPEAAAQPAAGDFPLIDLSAEPELEQSARVANPFAIGLIGINQGLERLAAEATEAIPRRLGICTSHVQDDDWNSVRDEPLPAVVPPMWQEIARRGQSPQQLPRPSRSARRRARRRNPNRQLTVDDYVPGWASPERSEEPGPPVERALPPRAMARREPPPEPVHRLEQPRRAGLVMRGVGVAPVWNAPAAKEQRSQHRGQERERPHKRRVIMFGNLTPVPTDPTVESPPFSCFNYWRWGHQMTNSPAERTVVYCHNCGRRGVDWSSCPRCSEVHQQFIQRTFAHKREIERRLDEQNRAALAVEEERRRLTAQADAARRREADRRCYPPRHEGAERHDELPQGREAHQVAEQQARRHIEYGAIGAVRLMPTEPRIDAALRLLDGLQELDNATREVVLRAVYGEPSQRR